MSDQDRESLSRIGLLDGLPAAEIVQLSAQCRWHRYAPHQQIIDQESDTRDVFFVVEGSARIVNYAASGREVSFEDIGEGGYFGELAAIDGGPRSASVVALTETMVCAVPARLFMRLVTENPAVARQLMIRLSHMIRQATGRIFDLSVLGAHNRVQAELLRLARPNEKDDGSSFVRPIPVHGDIAARVSTTRETVSRVFGDLTRQGLLHRERDSLVVTDMDRLTHLVEVFGDV